MVERSQKVGEFNMTGISLIEEMRCRFRGAQDCEVTECEVYKQWGFGYSFRSTCSKHQHQ